LSGAPAPDRGQPEHTRHATSRLLFPAKICALIAVTNAIGLAIFLAKRERS